MKKIKNKIIIISVFILSFVLFINSVSADPSAGVGGGSYVPGPASGGGGSYGGGMVSSIPVAYGFRVSIVDKNGNAAPKTHSIDYWSNWGYYNGNKNNTKLGYSALKDKKVVTFWGVHLWTYYEIPKPKTKGRSETAKTGSSLSSNYIKNYTLPSNYVDKNASEKYEVYLTSGGNATGGDKRIGNNYARIALDLFKEKVNKNDFTFLNSMLKDCGVPGKTDKERNVYAKSYYLLVEPLTAIYTQSWTNNAVAVGTTNDLRLMGILKNYSDYVYHYFMYINPVVFNTFKGGPLDSCSQSVQNDRNKIAGKGCVGAFTMYIGDIVKDNCSDNATKIVNDYFSNGELKSGKNEQDYLKALYKDETVRNECKIVKSGDKYYLDTTNSLCNVLDPLTMKLYKGLANSSNACSSVTCNSQANKLNANYKNANTIESLANKLFKYSVIVKLGRFT